MGRVLIVADDPGFRDAAVRELPDRQVFVAADASAALSLAHEVQPDLVFVDLWLDSGEATGRELVEALKASDPSRPVVLISAGLDASASTFLARRSSADLILCKGDATFLQIIEHFESGAPLPEPPLAATASFEQIKREYARRVVARAGNNRSEAARRLNVHRSTIRRILADADDCDA